MFRKSYRIAALTLALVLIVTASAAGAKQNSSPVAENLELTTYRGVSVGGRLSAVDPDGDMLHFEITTAPTKGELELGEDGHFIYTPADGKRGKDYFGYKACDDAGNSSQEATVIIRLIKQKTNVSYTDTAGLACAYAAHELAERDVLVGQCMGGRYVFEPERAVSRGEFLTMCMDIAGTDTLAGVRSTGFADDEAIPMWVKPYVSTALLSGVIAGYAQEGGAIFDASAGVSYSEAAVMLSRVMQVSDVADTAAFIGTDVPTWASQEVANLAACDIISEGTLLSRVLTRADAAQMLVRAMAVLER